MTHPLHSLATLAAGVRRVCWTVAVVGAMAVAAVGQQQRGPVPEQTAPAVATNGGYYALVIGINRYPSSDMPALYTAERDADAMAAVLGQSYGFQVQKLTGAQATRANILRALTGYRKTLKEEDSLLIYFAGHGTRDVDVSYWLPYDADMSSAANWVSASDITSGMKGQPARHVLVISDSCYSGGLSRDVKLGLRPADKAAYLSKMLTGRSRTLMESGGLEPVSDGAPNGHSVFADAVLDALQRPEIDVISAEDLFYGYIKERVAGSSKQTPEYDVIYDSGHREGDFVFVRRGAHLVSTTKAEPASSGEVVTQTPPPMTQVPKLPDNEYLSVNLVTKLVDAALERNGFRSIRGSRSDPVDGEGNWDTNLSFIPSHTWGPESIAS